SGNPTWPAPSPSRVRCSRTWPPRSSRASCPEAAPALPRERSADPRAQFRHAAHENSSVRGWGGLIELPHPTVWSMMEPSPPLMEVDMRRLLLGAPLAALAAVAATDLRQTRYPILRTFPALGHARMALTAIGPELRQYI